MPRLVDARRPLLLAPLAFAMSACGAPPPIATHVDAWRDEVVYQIVTDRFANGDPSNDDADGVEPVPGDLSRIQGGDFAGVVDHLDYIERLGATTLWISPIVRNVARMDVGDGYHGYWSSDSTAIEPRFGSLDELRALVDAAHARGLHVIVDVVTNHTGRVFFYDLDRDGVEDDGEAQPPYQDRPYDAPVVFTEPARLFAPLGPDLEGDTRSEADPGVLELAASHFHRRGYGSLSIAEQRRYGDFPDGLRDFDTERDDVVAAHVQTWVTWVLRTDVDGLRLDAVPHAEVPFWQAFCASLRARLARQGKHRFFLLGEIFETDPDAIAPYVTENALDAGFDIPFKYGFVDDVIVNGNAPSRGARFLAAPASFRTSAQPLGIDVDPWHARVAILDNHDTGRLRAIIADDFAVDQGLVAVFTLDAIPGVYYGTEQELSGAGGHAAREPLWDTGFSEDVPTYRLIQTLAAIRRANTALRRGSLTVRFASTTGARAADGEPTTGIDDAGLVAWERADGDHHALVVLNTHPSQASRATFPTTLPRGRYVDVLESDDAIDVDDTGEVDVTVPPRRSRIFVAVP